MVNGYLVEGGNLTISVEYQGKETYLELLGAIAIALIVSTAGNYYGQRNTWKKDKDAS
jgi:hypothetical protein